MRKIFIGIVITLIGGAVAYGLYLTGFPSSQRQARFDERRISDLQQISQAVSSYHAQAGRLPEDLEAFGSLSFFAPSMRDPKTGEMYEYRVTGELAYELCAVFDTDSSLAPTPRSPRFLGIESWEHGIARQCFSREVLVKEQGN